MNKADSSKSLKKGQAFVSTSKGIFPIDILKKSALQKDSKQLQEEEKFNSAENIVSPPYSAMSFLTLYESNPTFAASVNQIAVDVAGLGWNVVLKEDAKENDEQLEKVKLLLNRPNKEYMLRELFKRVLVDWGVIGRFTIEIVRDMGGEVVELFHIPSATMRIDTKKEKYVQIRNNKKVWFKPFGAEYEVKASDGTKSKDVQFAARGNEVIWYNNYYPLSDYYGMPCVLPAVGDVIGLIGARDFNLSFFENYGIPDAIILLEGDWEEDAKKVVEDFMDKNLRGVENAHKTLVTTQPDGVKFTYKPLGVELHEGSFKLYQADLKENILMSYSMPPERVGIRPVGKLGGNMAEEATKVYVQSTVEPLQKTLEDIVTFLIIEQGLEVESYEFKFVDLDLRDLDAAVSRFKDLISHGVMTPNEARAELGKKPYDDGEKFYVMSQLVEAGEPIDEL